MRLLNVCRENDGEGLPELVDFLPNRIPPYAILSHRWNTSPSQEIAFVDLMQSNKKSKKSLQLKQGYQKFMDSCMQTRRHGLDYLWIDTCCIDKSSSAELSEAINSMFSWYSRAQVCFVHLADVPSTVDIMSSESEFTRTEWATRGWTLQELLAPSEVIFYSYDWHAIGTKESLSSILSLTTGVDEEYLTMQGVEHLWSASIAKRMSWAARRKTSRPEDVAYCLMGLFRVNMPMLYGEGENAFIRLQEEIMKHSDDHSLFAWRTKYQDDDAVHGLLAKHPCYFERSGSIFPYADREDQEARTPFSMSNRGLSIELHLNKLKIESMYLAVLDCPVPPKYEDSKFLAIYLKKLPFSHNQYARVKVGRFGEAHRRSSLQKIFVRQSIVIPDGQGVFPSHVLQLRKFSSWGGGYRVTRTMLRDYPKKATDVPQAIQTKPSALDWTPRNSMIACKVTKKEASRAHIGIQVVFKEIESIVILLGTIHMQAGFGLILTTSLELNEQEQQELFKAKFVPSLAGSTVKIGYHRVCVSAEPVVVGDAKYYMFDIQITAPERQLRLGEVLWAD